MIVRNFLFHRVSDERDELWPPMTPALFERIIGMLVNNYRVVCLEEWLKEGAPDFAGKKVATVLFDDGYKDNIEYAAPILEKYNCPASFYVVTDCINKNIPTWTYLLDHALQQTKVTSICVHHNQAPELFKNVSLSEKQLVRKIKPWMKKLPDTERQLVLDSILAQCSDIVLPENKMMSWNDVAQLDHAGFQIGSHTHTHPMLAALRDESEIFSELSTSFQIIKDKTGKTPVTISYPIGSYDERAIRLSRQAGYKYGLAVEQKSFRCKHDDLMAIPRIELHQEPWWKVRLRINGIYQKARQLW
jgi:peptidoglycan/xylan/chitin deacetylase (PgdA/CDA1 family)